MVDSESKAEDGKKGADAAKDAVVLHEFLEENADLRDQVSAEGSVQELLKLLTTSVPKEGLQFLSFLSRFGQAGLRLGTSEDGHVDAIMTWVGGWKLPIESVLSPAIMSESDHVNNPLVELRREIMYLPLSRLPLLKLEYVGRDEKVLLSTTEELTDHFRNCEWMLRAGAESVEKLTNADCAWPAERIAKLTAILGEVAARVLQVCDTLKVSQTSVISSAKKFVRARIESQRQSKG
jgi:hypothetical protein